MNQHIVACLVLHNMSVDYGDDAIKAFVDEEGNEIFIDINDHEDHIPENNNNII